MPKPRMTLRMIKDVIRLKWEAKLSHEQIASALKMSKGAVGKYVGLASAAGLDWEVVRDWDEQQLQARLLPRLRAGSARTVMNVARSVLLAMTVLGTELEEDSRSGIEILREL